MSLKKTLLKISATVPGDVEIRTGHLSKLPYRDNARALRQNGGKSRNALIKNLTQATPLISKLVVLQIILKTTQLCNAWKIAWLMHAHYSQRMWKLKWKTSAVFRVNHAFLFVKFMFYRTKIKNCTSFRTHQVKRLRVWTLQWIPGQPTHIKIIIQTDYYFHKI